LADVFGVPVATVENHRRFYAYSRARFAGDSRVSVTLGDSRDFLRERTTTAAGQTAFIYLDAHWGDDLPLREELQIIASAWRRAVVVVDDFAVPGDRGYGYDDYGPGKALVEDCLPPLPGWALYYPTAPSEAETGERRGCCVLLSPAMPALETRELRLARVL
jgi:hypothetical protein